MLGYVEMLGDAAILAPCQEQRHDLQFSRRETHREPVAKLQPARSLGGLNEIRSHPDPSHGLTERGS